MSEEGYRIKWRDKKLTASEITDGIKWAFSVWCYNWAIENDRVRNTTPGGHVKFKKEIALDPPEWTSIADDSINAALKKKPGQRQIMRLILNVDEDEMDEKDFDEMIAEKEADPNSDLMLAMEKIRENADPKVKKGGHGSPRPEAEENSSPPSAENPSS